MKKKEKEKGNCHDKRQQQRKQVIQAEKENNNTRTKSIQSTMKYSINSESLTRNKKNTITRQLIT